MDEVLFMKNHNQYEFGTLNNMKKNILSGGLRTIGKFKKSLKSKPLISVITVVFNGEKYIESTIKSVIKQSYDNIEYIIIDGGSSDRTIKIIAKYDHKIDYWISEKDNGIYEAMNKGIALSKGDFIGFLNADDFLYNNSLIKIANAYVKKKFDYTVGPVDLINKDGSLVEKMNFTKNFLKNNKFIVRMASPHQSFYLSRKLISKIGLFDENFSVSADFDLSIRAISSSKKYFEFPDSTGSFRIGGLSGSYLTYYENFFVLKKHGVPIYKNLWITLLSLIKLIINKYFPVLRRFIKLFFLQKN